MDAKLKFIEILLTNVKYLIFVPGKLWLRYAHWQLMRPTSDGESAHNWWRCALAKRIILVLPRFLPWPISLIFLKKWALMILTKKNFPIKFGAIVYIAPSSRIVMKRLWSGRRAISNYELGNTNVREYPQFVIRNS